MPRIFISYRREDSIAYAGRIYDRLIAQFGAANVFMDVDTLEPGVNFVEMLQQTVSSCDVFLAVIGVDWFAAKDEEGRARLSNPEDFVALEIGAALERHHIRVVPILVGGAGMPRSTELPPQLADLTRRHALVLPDIGFHQALGRLIDSIERAEQERTDREDGDHGAQRQAARSEQQRLAGVTARGKSEWSRTRLLAYGLGGLATLLAAVFFVVHDKVTTQQSTLRTNPKDGLPYRWIPTGSFTMGCSSGDMPCGDEEKPAHAEQIANGYWLGQTEVTQAAWKRVMHNNPSYFQGDQLPVENVDWNQASAYCETIGGRLPTEIEWEYAARAGTVGPRYGTLDDIAWYHGNSGLKSHPVGLKQANAYGLYDMLGNVREWASDSYGDGNGISILRGISWNGLAKDVRASFRSKRVPGGVTGVVGLRCVWNLR